VSTAAVPVRPRRLILWDIDGTLLTSGPIGREAFFAGAAEVLGRKLSQLAGEEDGPGGVRMSGRTDPLIALDILERAGVPEPEARRLLPDVLAALARHLTTGIERIRAEGQVHPGVVEVLERLDAEPEVVQTVLTGNLAVNARAKVEAFGLERFLDLDVGAYGSDEAHRDRLVPVAQARVRDRYGHAPAPGETWIVGDTALDLACAKAAGARCLLVATGRIELRELEPLDADGVFANLSDVESVAALLAG
jgi:phosphoglycolate phosphatase-like HAD superfamily hydrolase